MIAFNPLYALTHTMTSAYTLRRVFSAQHPMTSQSYRAHLLLNTQYDNVRLDDIM